MWICWDEGLKQTQTKSPPKRHQFGSSPPEYRASAGIRSRVHTVELAPFDVTVQHPEIPSCRQPAIHVRGTMKFRPASDDSNVRVRPAIHFIHLAGLRYCRISQQHTIARIWWW